MTRLMLNTRVAALVVSVWFGIAGCQSRSAPPKPESPNQAQAEVEDDSPESIRIHILAESLDAGHAEALDRFWKEVKREGSPLVEEIVGDPDHRMVTYLWRREGTHSVHFSGLRPPHGEPKPFRQLKGTDLWYRSEIMPKDSRGRYAFRVDIPASACTSLSSYRSYLKAHPDAWGKDPLNPKAIDGMSLLELPDAPQCDWLEEGKDTNRGTLRSELISSKAISEGRELICYTPVGFDSSQTTCLLLMLDGDTYGTRDTRGIPVPTILDHLIQERKIPPTVAVFVKNPNSRTRDRDMTCHPEFAEFLANEVVPFAAKKWNVKLDPSRTIIGGSSLSGLCSLYTCWKHPDVFGKVLSQSGSFIYSPVIDLHDPESIVFDAQTNWLSEQIASGPAFTPTVYLEVGAFERYLLIDLVAENRRMRDVLRAKGAKVNYREPSNQHDSTCWKYTFADGLLSLISDH